MPRLGRFGHFVKNMTRFTNPLTLSFAEYMHDRADNFPGIRTGQVKVRDYYRRPTALIMESLPDDYNIKECTADDLRKWMKVGIQGTAYHQSFPIVQNFILEFLLEHDCIHSLDGFDGSPFKEECRYFLAKGEQFVGKMFFQAATSDKPLTFFRLVSSLPATPKSPNQPPHPHLWEFGMGNTACQDLIIRYFQNGHEDGRFRFVPTPFIPLFAESLGFDVPSSASGFNAETFEHQYRFFEPMGRRTLQHLRYFYLYLAAQDDTCARSLEKSGLPPLYIGYCNFIKYFPKGYRAVYLNPNDDTPESDRWALFPNGHEKKTATTQAYNMWFIDFTAIDEPELRQAAKDWFWGVAESNLLSRKSEIRDIFDFFAYRKNLREHHLLDFMKVRGCTPEKAEMTIFAEEVFSFTTQFQDKATQSRVRIYGALSRFLRYLQSRGVYEVEEALFPYLRVNARERRMTNPVSHPLEDEDFLKLHAALKEKRTQGTINELYYILFVLNSLTQLRISSILDLDCDCLNEPTRKGVYSVHARLKTGGADFQNIQIPKECCRLIQRAVELTQPLRDEAPEEAKHYLFLLHNSRFKYTVIAEGSYRGYLKAVCEENGLPPCTPGSLRKTYMTNYVREAIRKGVSLLDLHSITGHASFDTTERHYVEEKARDYLLEMNGIEIGQGEVSGSVVDTYHGTEKDAVEGDCGYCRNPECNIEGTAPCLMCKSFITTVKHIPVFREAIAAIDKKMDRIEGDHDREQLFAVKQLYAMYLAKMYELAAKERGGDSRTPSP